MRPTFAIACAFIACALGLLLRYETAVHEITGAASSCTVNQAIDCDAVQTSVYAKLFGVSVSLWAAAGSALFAALLLMRHRFGDSMLLAAGALGAANAITSLVYLGISIFALGINCLYCNGIQVLSIASFVLILPAAWRARSAGLPKQTMGATALAGTLVLFFVLIGEHYTTQRTRLGQMRDVTVGTQRMRVEVSDAMVLGDPVRGAENSYVIFFDFGCPRCLECYQMATDLVRRAPDRVHFFFKHWPLDRNCNKTLHQTSHPESCRAAAAGVAAASVGKSAEALRALFDLDKLFTTKRLKELWGLIGLTSEEWLAVFDSEESKNVVARDVAEGNRLGLSGVPAVFRNGRKQNDLRLPRR